MSTETPAPVSTIQQRIDERLDAVDRALLGLLPRPQRLALVADLQAQVAAYAPSLDASSLASSLEPVGETTGRTVSTRRQRSRMAVTAGILGILALLMLFALPIVFVGLALIGEMLGETFSIVLLGGHALLLTFAGLMAIGLGTIALFRLLRRQGATGHGWAITALCTGPMPVVFGGLAVVMFTAAVCEIDLLSVTASSTPPVQAQMTTYNASAVGTPYSSEGYFPPAALPAGNPSPMVAGMPDVPDAKSQPLGDQLQQQLSTPALPAVEPSTPALPPTVPAPTLEKAPAATISTPAPVAVPVSPPALSEVAPPTETTAAAPAVCETKNP